MSDKGKITLLSVTKPVAVKDFPCIWGHEHPHTITKGSKYVRVVWQKNGEPIQSDHICVDCWTAE